MPEIRVPLEELRKNKLFVATPMYGGMAAGLFARSIADLSALCTHHGIQLQFYFLFNESLITRARNYCCDEFLRSDATHLMFIDSDIGFDPNDVLGLLAMTSDPTNGYDVIGGPYPKKCISWEKVKAAVDKGVADQDPNILERFVGDYVFNPKLGSASIPLNEPVEVLEIGTGFMMIRRKTLEAFRDKFPRIAYRPDHIRTAAFDGSRLITQFFQAEIDQLDLTAEYEALVSRLTDMSMDAPAIRAEIAEFQKNVEERQKSYSLRYLSEDYWFCKKVWELGLKVWFCPWMKMQHVGTYVFGGSLSDLAQIQVSATADPAALKKH